MLARAFLREHAARLAAEMPERFAGVGLASYTELEARRRDAVTRLEAKRSRRNELTSIREKPSPERIAEMKTLKEEIRALEEETAAADAELVEIETRVPNVPDASVPRGAD